MASQNTILAIVGGLVLAAGVGGGAAYIVLKGSAPKPAAAPAPAPLPAPPAPQEANASESAPDIATVDFTRADALFTIAKPTSAYVSASEDAPKMYDLPPGVGVHATEQSKDGKWLIAPTADGQAAFLPMADMGPFQAQAVSAVASLPDTIAGPATVIDTATLSINGQQITLFGVTGETGTYADQLQDMVNANGSNVSCQLQDQTYRCMLPNGLDIARVALYNGAARPGTDATDDYRNQAAAAQAAHKGVWQ
jgi:endonuclease YncB( thermonuclease family)